MTTVAATGKSSQRDARAAGREAAERALAACGGETPTLCLLFAAAGYDQDTLLRSVRETIPQARLAGCSGEGIIAGPESDESEHAVAVLAVRSDAIDFETFLVPGYAADPAGAGRELARRVDAIWRGDEFGLLLFPDGLLGNCSELLSSLDGALGRGIPIVGGTAGDSLRFQKTFQYHGDVIASGAVSAVLMRGRGRLETSVSHGCVPIGLERRVTRAEGGWMQEIDGRPAWSVFREYLHGDPDDLNAEGSIHLSVGEPLPEGVAGEYEPFVIRTPMGLDKSTGALFFPGGGIRSGGAIRLTRRDPEKICESGRACAARIASRHPDGPPGFVLQFDCAGRGRQLFGSGVAEQIVVPLQEVLGTQVPWIGFHTYGEIAPIGGTTYFHNFTVALCAIYEAA